jgi:hypothetical protein
VQDDIEQERNLVQAEDVLEKFQVAARRNRQEFGDSLDETEKQSL